MEIVSIDKRQIYLARKRENRKKYVEANKDKIIQKNKEYYEKNKEKINEKRRKIYLEKKDLEKQLIEININDLI